MSERPSAKLCFATILAVVGCTTMAARSISSDSGSTHTVPADIVATAPTQQGNRYVTVGANINSNGQAQVVSIGLTPRDQANDLFKGTLSNLPTPGLLEKRAEIEKEFQKEIAYCDTIRKKLSCKNHAADRRQQQLALVK